MEALARRETLGSQEERLQGDVCCTSVKERLGKTSGPSREPRVGWEQQSLRVGQSGESSRAIL